MSTNQKQIESKRAEYVKALETASVPYKAMYDADRALRLKRKSAEDALAEINSAILKHEADEKYVEFQKAVGAAQSQLNRFEYAAKYVPLIESLAPFRDVFKAMDSAESRRRMVATLAATVPTIENALVKVAPRNGDKKKHAKLTEKLWNEIETGMNLAREIVLQ